MRILFAALIVFLFSNVASAQLEPVTWTFEANKVTDTEYDIVFKADIERGWSVYSQFNDPEKGPVPTSFEYETTDVKVVGKAKEAGMKKEEMDENFGISVVKFSNRAMFTQRVKIEGDSTSLKGKLVYMTCDESSCLPPTCLLYTSPSPRDATLSRMPSSA